MKSVSRILALLLAVLTCAAVFASCSRNDGGDKTLVVGCSPFSGSFSPFFSETASDTDACGMTQLVLLTSDRSGAIVTDGISGETKEYGGTDYTYYGPADLSVTENPDGTVYYDFKLRDDLVFSDGEKLTVNDVVFSMYVLSDPMYDGASAFSSLPIEGMDAYRDGMKSLYSLLVSAGPGNGSFEYWDEGTQSRFWEASDAAFVALAQNIVDFCIAKGFGTDAASSAVAWGFKVAEGSTVGDFAAVLKDSYGNDIAAAVGAEAASVSVSDLIPDYTEYTGTLVKTGDSAPRITGIRKIDDFNLRIVMTEIDAEAIFKLAVPVAPLHYYGETDKFDYENNKFGFEKGDLSHIRSVTAQPVGAGPYRFVRFKDGVINYEANDKYYLGAPKTNFVNFVQCANDDDKISGVVAGTVDLTEPSFSVDTVRAIRDANPDGELEGDVITAKTVDNLVCGYIGMCANVMKVGDDPASDASGALRRAFGTVFSVYRDIAVEAYYGDRAAVINYPVSYASRAAFGSADVSKTAFSVDVDGKNIYTSDMSDADRYEAAKIAALGFFEKAGYTVEDGKVTAAPEGAKLEYQAWIPADGVGNHPAFRIFTEAGKALGEIGISLEINDVSDPSELRAALRAQSVAVWADAQSAAVDPDLYQSYFSGDGLHEAGGLNYRYAVDDPELNAIILDAGGTIDQSARKRMYGEALDIITGWAVEVPVYQRQNAVIFSTERVNPDTFTPDITAFYGWMNEIRNIEIK